MGNRWRNCHDSWPHFLFKKYTVGASWLSSSVAAALAYSQFQPIPATRYNWCWLQFFSGNDWLLNKWLEPWLCKLVCISIMDSSSTTGPSQSTPIKHGTMNHVQDSPMNHKYWHKRCQDMGDESGHGTNNVVPHLITHIWHLFMSILIGSWWILTWSLYHVW